MHSAYMIQMLDTALNMLGPDIELLSEIMHELGVKHVRYGVKPEMFPVMGEALFLTLENVLGSDFDTVTRAAWKETYGELSQDMVRAMAAPKRGSS
jgi:methyl-accepting chemotaxis protein